MNNKKNIYIVMEITRRELQGNLLLTLCALKNKFNVYISDRNTYRFLIKNNLINNGIIHTKSITHGKIKSQFHKDLYDKKFLITAIDEEHGVLDNFDYIKNFATNRLSIKELEKISAFFCWGEYDFENLKKHFKNYKKIFYLTGSPRVDIWKNKINLKNNDLIRNKFKNVDILVCTNFAFANNIETYKNLIKEQKKNGYYKRSPTLEEKNKKFYLYQKKSLPKFVELINYLALKFPKKNICIRPHPTENVNFWQNNINHRKNLMIDNSKPSSYWIKNCKILIQNNCTTGSEGIISDKIVINYSPFKNNGGFGRFVEKISINAKNKNEVYKIIKNQDKFKINRKNFKNKLNERILFKSKSNSATKISKVWVKLSKNKSFLQNNNFKIYFFLLIYETFKSLILKLLLSIKGKKKKIENILNYKFPEHNEDFIKREINIIAKEFNYKNKFTIKKLGRKLFYFEQI